MHHDAENVPYTIDAAYRSLISTLESTTLGEMQVRALRPIMRDLASLARSALRTCPAALVQAGVRVLDMLRYITRAAASWARLHEMTL